MIVISFKNETLLTQSSKLVTFLYSLFLNNNRNSWVTMLITVDWLTVINIVIAYSWLLFRTPRCAWCIRRGWKSFDSSRESGGDTAVKVSRELNLTSFGICDPPIFHIFTGESHKTQQPSVSIYCHQETAAVSKYVRPKNWNINPLWGR